MSDYVRSNLPGQLEYLRGAAYRMLGCMEFDAQVDDLLQEVATKALRYSSTFTHPAHPADCIKAFRGWLVCILKNILIDAARRVAKHRDTELEEDHLAVEVRWEETFLDLMEEKVYTLPGIFRGPVNLVVIQGQSYDEAGQALGIPGGTVKSRVSRALRLLRRRIEERSA